MWNILAENFKPNDPLWISLSFFLLDLMSIGEVDDFCNKGVESSL